MREDNQGNLHGWLSYHAPASQSLRRRRLHRRFWSLSPEFQVGRLDLESTAIWSRPEGPLLLRDHSPDWSLLLCDWTGQVQSELRIPEPKRRLEFLPRQIVSGPKLYLLGEGDDFTWIYLCNKGLEQYLETEANEAMAGAWVLDELAYGGWSGRLRWKDRCVQLGSPIQDIRSLGGCPWVLVRTQTWELVHLPDQIIRTLGPASAATLIPQGVAWAGRGLQLQDWNGEKILELSTPSPLVALEWLPLSQSLAALLEDESILRFQCPSGFQSSQLNLIRALPALPTSQSLPYNFAGRASFHANGNLSFIVSQDGSDSLELSHHHDSGKASFDCGELTQRYYANGTVEQFSSWDDNSQPQSKPFEDWALQSLERIWT